MVPWSKNTTILYRGHEICAVEESGRRFWTASVPDKGGWSLRQEFSNSADAAAYIDERSDDE